MKANEAPEKIYVPTTGDELHYHMACPNNEFQESIEYTRTDAFIEKSCEWLESVNLDYYQIREGVFSRELVDDFRKAMKGGISYENKYV